MLPFRRAAIHEKVVQAIVYPVTLVLAAMVLVPFVMTLALSFGDVDDFWAGRKWPDLRHLRNPGRFYIHYLATRYDYWGSMTGFDELYGVQTDAAGTILALPAVPELKGAWRKRAADGIDCLRLLPWTHFRPLFTGWFYYRGCSANDFAAFTGLTELDWKRYLKATYGTIERVNAKFGTTFISFPSVKVPGLASLGDRSGFPAADPWLAEYIAFLKTTVKRERCLPLLGDAAWRGWLRVQPEIGGDLARLNAALGGTYPAWSDVTLSETVPAPGPARRYWETFVRTVVSPYLLELKVTPGLEQSFQKFLRGRHGSGEAVQARYGAPPESVRLPANARDLASATAYADWDAFSREAPAEVIMARGADAWWRQFLREKYGTPERAAEAWGVPVPGFDAVPWPQPEIDRLDWANHRFEYTREVLFKNYRRVWSLMTDATSSLLNTALFAIVFTVLSVAVNAGAAYVLSRFGLGPIQMSLVFFLALAAFPIEAMAVPNFLLLRNLGLLNSLWALVLPTAVNGYYIYLLKSYFDAIPRSYYEEATLEGASEWRLFWFVGIPLAAPMLAVVGLYALLWSYANFMWALIVCQQRAHWTLPVMLFNMNTWAATPMLAAAIMIAVLPPLVVFIFAHRTLQRSLALPRF
ncbi:MAG: carbohydrate ABC transporter permease [Candidatus Coatesbacteria bacterium]